MRFVAFVLSSGVLFTLPQLFGQVGSPPSAQQRQAENQRGVLANAEIDAAVRAFDSGNYDSSLPTLERFQNQDSRAGCRIGLALVEARTKPDLTRGSELIKVAAESGDALCMAEQGVRVYRGWGTGKDPLTGTSLIERSAEKGSPRGKAYLAGLYMAGVDQVLDCKKAKAILDSVVSSGEPEVWTQLGLLYYMPKCADAVNGENRAALSVSFTRRAYDKGSVMAAFQLGTFYHYGIGLARNLRSAETLYQFASEHGNPWAMINLGYLRQINEGGLTKNIDESMRLYTQAAHMGESGGNRELGDLFVKGEHVPRNLTKGLDLFGKAIEAGDVAAMRTLASYYEEGKFGLSKDGAGALRYYERACGFNDGNSCMLGGGMRARGKVVAKDAAAALPMLEKAVSLGNVRALLWLGWLYEQGEGKAQNFQEAFRLYKLAESKGDTEAAMRIQQLYEHQRNPRGWRGALGIPF